MTEAIDDAAASRPGRNGTKQRAGGEPSRLVAGSAPAYSWGAEPAGSTRSDRGMPATRRRLLSGAGNAFAAAAAAAAVAAVASVITEEPAGCRRDAELLRLLARFDALEGAIWPVGPEGVRTIVAEEERETLVAPLRAEQAILLDRICGLRARTVAGFRARARSLLLWDGEMRHAIESGDDPDGCTNERLMEALVRDVAATEPADARPPRAAVGDGAG